MNFALIRQVCCQPTDPGGAEGTVGLCWARTGTEHLTLKRLSGRSFRNHLEIHRARRSAKTAAVHTTNKADIWF